MGNTSAVVLIDLQNSQSGRSLGPHSLDSVVENANRLIQAGREANALIVYVVTSHLTSGGDTLAVVADNRPSAPHVRPAGWDQPLETLTPRRADSDPLTIKRGWDAFYGSALDLQLRRHGVTDIVLSGVSTNFGVEGTARAAIDRGYQVVFAEDAMTSHTSHLHEFAVTQLFPRMGRVTATSDAVDLLRTARPTVA